MPTAISDIDAMGLRYVIKNMRADDREEVFALRWDDDDDKLALDVMASGPMKWMLSDDALPVCVWGAQEMWPGMWNVWMFATEDFFKVALSLTKFVLCQEIPMLVDQHIQRAECKSIATNTVAHRWLEHVGAVREARHSNYGRLKESFYTYAWNF